MIPNYITELECSKSSMRIPLVNQEDTSWNNVLHCQIQALGGLIQKAANSFLEVTISISGNMLVFRRTIKELR
jgi:hypothetical protein